MFSLGIGKKSHRTGNSGKNEGKPSTATVQAKYNKLNNAVFSTKLEPIESKWSDFILRDKKVLQIENQGPANNTTFVALCIKSK